MNNVELMSKKEKKLKNVLTKFDECVNINKLSMRQ